MQQEIDLKSKYNGMEVLVINKSTQLQNTEFISLGCCEKAGIDKNVDIKKE